MEGPSSGKPFPCTKHGLFERALGMQTPREEGNQGRMQDPPVKREAMVATQMKGKKVIIAKPIQKEQGMASNHEAVA